MKFWRISNYADLSGIGGLKFAGRWHSIGRPILYTADHPAGALNEVLVNFEATDMPDTLQLLEIEVDAALVQDLPLGALPKNWRTGRHLTQPLGDAWLADQRSLGLRVPSALVPQVWNVLLNTAHPRAHSLKIAGVEKFALDIRFS